MTTHSAPTQLAGWHHIYSGKVRDLYTPEPAAPAAEDAPTAAAAENAGDYLLVVASNRVSAFDFVLDPEIPGKGAILTKLSRWWFERIEQPNHLVSGIGAHAGVSAIDAPAVPDSVADRSMLTRRLEMYPIECVVRGAITGSGLAEYRETGAVCGIELPAGLEDGDLLDEPIYTPAYKAPLGEHDENITFERSAEIVGSEVAEALREASLRIFTRARDLAVERGVVLADTKFEFGRDQRTGELVLADEVLTSDSSRYWDAAAYHDTSLSRSERLASFDKQIVRNWLAENWDKQGTPPRLPDEIVAQTYARYEELFTRLAG